MLIAGIILLIVLIATKLHAADQNSLALTATIVTNTIYEAFLMFLLGYGLVEFPREIWRTSDLTNYKRVIEMKAATDNALVQETRTECRRQVNNVMKTRDLVRSNQDPRLMNAMAVSFKN